MQLISILVFSLFILSLVFCDIQQKDHHTHHHHEASPALKKKARGLAEKIRRDHPTGFGGKGLQYEDLLKHSKLLLDLFLTATKDNNDDENLSAEAVCEILVSQIPGGFVSQDQCTEHVKNALEMVKGIMKDGPASAAAANGLFHPSLLEGFNMDDIQGMLGKDFDPKKLLMENIKDPELKKRAEEAGLFNEDYHRLIQDLGKDLFGNILGGEKKPFNAKSEI